MKIIARLKFIIVTLMFLSFLHVFNAECSQVLKFSKTTNSVEDSDFNRIQVSKLLKSIYWF